MRTIQKVIELCIT
uniref:Uncharacterized protein n=1 Tax=Arundo donax TaxID=35708 RepID=A0A0A9H1B8_ARUDO